MTSTLYTYQTIVKPGTGKLTDRGSKFFGYASAMDKRADLESLVEHIKSEHPKARHICVAYRFLVNGIPEEYSTDDGEPSGSAGLPILGALRSAELYNCCAIVVRYFGGTKLGVPGLIEAYRGAAQQAISDAGIAQHVRTENIAWEMPIAVQPHFYNAAKQLKIRIDDPQYLGDRLVLKTSLPIETKEIVMNNLLKLLSKRDYDELDGHLEYLDMRVLD